MFFVELLSPVCLGNKTFCIIISFNLPFFPLKVRINTGKNTTLKFSERKEQKEQAKRKKKNCKSNGHSPLESYKITSPADIYK